MHKLKQILILICRGGRIGTINRYSSISNCFLPNSIWHRFLLGLRTVIEYYYLRTYINATYMMSRSLSAWFQVPRSAGTSEGMNY